MGIASLILGIISILIAFIPLCGMIATLPAIIGLILGIAFVVSAKKSNQPFGIGLAGIILNALSLAFITIWTVVILAAGDDSYDEFNEMYKDVKDSIAQVKESIEKEITDELGEIVEE